MISCLGRAELTSQVQKTIRADSVDKAFFYFLLRRWKEVSKDT
jgi:hypothetical protein